MMSFQKLTALVALVVFALQGAMAAPRPYPPLPIVPPRPQDAVDGLLGTAGEAAGTYVPAILPSDMIKQGIEGAGGIVPPKIGHPYPYLPAPAGPQDIADNLADNAAKTLSTDGAAILPSDFVKPAVKAAGGIVSREKDA